MKKNNKKRSAKVENLKLCNKTQMSELTATAAARVFKMGI